MPIARKVFIPGTVTTAADVITFIANSYDADFLRKVRHLADDRLRGELTAIKRRQLSTGDRVMFYSKKKGTVYGQVQQVNRTAAKVMADDGLLWNVALTILRQSS